MNISKKEYSPKLLPETWRDLFVLLKNHRDTNSAHSYDPQMKFNANIKVEYNSLDCSVVQYDCYVFSSLNP